MAEKIQDHVFVVDFKEQLTDLYEFLKFLSFSCKIEQKILKLMRSFMDYIDNQNLFASTIQTGNA